MSREVRGGQNSCVKWFGMFSNFVSPSKLANIPHCHVFLIQLFEGNCIFSRSLAKLGNIPRRKFWGKHPPLKSGGLVCHLCICCESANVWKQLKKSLLPRTPDPQNLTVKVHPCGSYLFNCFPNNHSIFVHPIAVSLCQCLEETNHIFTANN